jgi:hypothetical protein
MARKSAEAAREEEFLIDVMTIDGKSISTRVGMLDQTKLRFWPDNPRVYSIIREPGREPTQDDIQLQLQDMEHVRALVQDIRKHGGLVDPLVVKDGTFEVVEGNSRLAAYRFLSSNNPVKWSRVKCRLLPLDITDDLIASLLGQWHLKGKKEWLPFEQAGYLYRRHRQQNVPLATLAREAGTTASRVEKIIDAYELMLEQNDTRRDRWSYYDELVKSRKIMKSFEQSPGLRTRVLKMVKGGKFARAQDVRDKLPTICSAPTKVRTKFVAEKLDFDDAYDAAKEAGGGDARYQRLHKVRLWLAEQEVQDDLLKTTGELRAKIEFELKKIQGLAGGLLKKL